MRAGKSGAYRGAHAMMTPRGVAARRDFRHIDCAEAQAMS